MTNIAPNQSASNQSECHKCRKPIFWHKSQAGKNYPTDSPTDRKAFHQCGPAQQPAKNPEPLTPDYFDLEPTVEERVAALEKQLAALVRTVKAVQNRQPITAEDVGF